MNEYITLLGTEDVVRAGNRMSSAADTMSQAASSIDDTLERFLRRYEELVVRQEVAAAMEAKKDDRSIFEMVFGKS